MAGAAAKGDARPDAMEDVTFAMAWLALLTLLGAFGAVWCMDVMKMAEGILTGSVVG